MELDGRRLCVFCQDPNPTKQHLEAHNFTACQEKTLQERTFYRKDHLRQHLRLLHNAKFLSWMEAWKSVTTEIKSSCGFCPQLFSTWQQRADHLAAHFRNGSDMRDWAGSWGFEPYVERLVENSVPPYLIAMERSSMDPFVARAETTPSSGTFGTSAPSITQINHDSNCWRRMEQGLSAYIMQQKQLGIIPTDNMIQDQARMIIYDNNDPIDQTAADHPIWLEALKQQHGISQGSSLVPLPKLEEVPMLPPYIVPGGLKQARRTAVSSTGVASGTFTPDPSGMPVSAAPMLDPTMDFDFDQIDFSNLDLGLIDETGLDSSLPEQRFDVSGSVPQTEGMPVLGGFEMQQDHMGQETLMSEQDLNELSRYMSGFN